MKKILPIVIVAAIVGAALWFFLGRGASGEAPGIANTLPTATTTGLAGVQDVHTLSARVFTTLKALPPEQLKGLPPQVAALLDPAKRDELIGFDITTAEGWASVGIDPTAGQGMVVDARLALKGQPVPLAFFKVTDQAKLFAFIEKKAGVKPAVDESKAPLKVLTIKDKPVLFFGERQGWTVALLQSPKQVKDLEAAFTSYLGETSGDLANDPSFEQAMDGAAKLQGYGYLNSKSLVTFMENLVKAGAPKTIVEDGNFYAALFPGVGSWLGSDDMGGRLVASEKGVQLIRKLFVPAQAPGAFSQLIPAKGYSAVRLSINLKDLFNGVADALPPSQAKIKGQVGMAPMGLAMVGLNWADLNTAFTGHFVWAGDAGSAAGDKGPMGISAIMLMGIGNTDKADSLVPELLGLVAKTMGGAAPKAEAVELEGHKGHKVSLGPLSVVAIRVDKVLVVGPEPAVKAALLAKKGEHLSDKAAVSCLDDADVIFGTYMDLESIKALVKKGGDKGAEAMLTLTKDIPSAGAIRHDGHGVFVRAGGMMTLIGASAAIAIPAFTKYIARSKAAQRDIVKMQREQDEVLKKLRAPVVVPSAPAAPASAR